MTPVETRTRLQRYPLYLNSIYLLMSTAVMAVLGFMYWIIAARLYTSADLGVAATLISALTYISMISQLGINAGIMRFLPKANDRATTINTGLTLVVITSLSISAVFLLAVKRLVPDLADISASVWTVISFLIFMALGALNVTLESVLIALRNGATVLLKNSLVSISRIAFLVLFLAFGAFGIFSSWALATLVGVLCALVVLAVTNAYRPRPRIHYAEIGIMAGYSFGNYVGGIFGNLPQYLLPLFLTAWIGPSTTAYFNVAMSYAALLFSIPISICHSLLVEGSIHEDQITKSTVGAIKLIALILLPAVAFALVFGERALTLFGLEYASNSAQLLSVLSISSVFVAGNTICWTILNLQRRVKEIIVVLAVNATVVIGLSWILIGYGLNGIGAAWTIGQAITGALYLIVLVSPYGRRLLRRP